MPARKEYRDEIKLVKVTRILLVAEADIGRLIYLCHVQACNRECPSTEFPRILMRGAMPFYYCDRKSINLPYQMQAQVMLIV